jgi:hypothetical protein
MAACGLSLPCRPGGPHAAEQQPASARDGGFLEPRNCADGVVRTPLVSLQDRWPAVPRLLRAALRRCQRAQKMRWNLPLPCPYAACAPPQAQGLPAVQALQVLARGVAGSEGRQGGTAGGRLIVTIAHRAGKSRCGMLLLGVAAMCNMSGPVRA